MMYTFEIILASMTAGGLIAAVARREADRRRRDRKQTAVTRIDAHLASNMRGRMATPAKPLALRRDVQEVVETSEASHDLAILDQTLRDIRDLSGADEAIFWRWVEARQTLVPSSWSSEDRDRPSHFNMRALGPLVRWSAEERVIQVAGDGEGAPTFVSVPVMRGAVIYGALSVTADRGLSFDRETARSWMPRFADQVSGLVELFELRRQYGRHMRQSEALLGAVQRLHGHRNAEGLAAALCQTTCEVTSASRASLVRWNAVDGYGVVQAISADTGDIEPGFHVTGETMIGRVCTNGLALVLEDATSATEPFCPFGGMSRPVGSVAIAPIESGNRIIGALVVEGDRPGVVSVHELRNVELLSAVARGPLEIVWEIEEVSRRARTDALTGLANRRHFDEQLRRVIAETDRFGGASSLIMIDLDHFKSINDRYGHEGGDAVLRHVSKLLTEAVRTVDLCARYGGEEIAVLLPQTKEEGAVELAERLRVSLQTHRAPLKEEMISVTASFGVATYPKPVPYGDWLLPAADRALYEAKAAGRNCVKFINSSQVSSALYKPHD